MGDWAEIYEFWFGAPNSEGHGGVREFWFGGGPGVDREIKDRFLGDYHRAASEDFDGWKTEARSCVAPIVLLDQFPRNMFRGDAGSYAADPLALATARHLVSSPMHDELFTVEKVFTYLPFEHSENIIAQEECVSLFSALDEHEFKQEWIEYALEHKVIVEEFGHFPHRNKILGRDNTSAEDAWLAASDQRFGTAAGDGDQK
jgi:uncharacterized protein (DUF924 family)